MRFTVVCHQLHVSSLCCVSSNFGNSWNMCTMNHMGYIHIIHTLDGWMNWPASKPVHIKLIPRFFFFLNSGLCLLSIWLKQLCSLLISHTVLFFAVACLILNCIPGSGLCQRVPAALTLKANSAETWISVMFRSFQEQRSSLSKGLCLTWHSQVLSTDTRLSLLSVSTAVCSPLPVFLRLHFADGWRNAQP